MKMKLKLLFKIKILLFLIIMLTILQIKIKAQENSWYQTNGPYGGDVGSLVFDSTGNLFAGTTEGIYRSTDKGNHWVQFGFKDTNVTGLIINKKGQIFACYGLVSATVPVYPCHGIYRSNDGGISWQLKISGFYSQTPAISFAMTKDGILYAGTIGSGVFRSTNDGDTWTHLSFGDTTGEVACLAFASDSLFILGTEYSGLHRSTNAGTIWQKISSLNCYSLAVDAGGNIYAGTDKGIYISTDQGNNWNPSTLQVDWIHSVFIDSSGNIFAGTQNNGLYRSTDKGGSWIHMGLKVKTIFSLSSNSGSELLQELVIMGSFILLMVD
jgi:ligand-binding sensor domain-containing protein